MGKTSFVLVSLAALSLATGCKKESEAASQPTATTEAKDTKQDAHAKDSSGPHAAPPHTAHAGQGEPGSATGGDLKTMFAGPPQAGTKDSETIVATQGVVLGFPAKWTSGNVYDETSYESPKPSPTTQGAVVHCEKSGAKLDKTELHRLLFAAMAQKEKWTEEVEGTVGVDKFPAEIGRGIGEAIAGKHEPVDVLYVYTTKIPGATPVLCAASVPQSQPALFKELETVFKGMKNSRAKK